MQLVVSFIHDESVQMSKSLLSFITILLLLSTFLTNVYGRRPLPQLDPTGACDYVIITPTKLAASFQPLADWKSERGIRTRVIPLERINKLYPSGDGAKSIRNFLKEAYRVWGIKWVLLGGDITDIEGNPLVPCRMAQATVKSAEQMPADLYFSSLDGAWDSDNNGIYGEVTDQVDLEPEVFVGRAPVRTAEEVAAFVDKLMLYEKQPIAGLTRRGLWIGAALDETTPGKDVIKTIIKEAKVPQDIENKILSTTDGNLNLEALTTEINEYLPHTVFFAAHGSPDLIALDGSYYKNENVDELVNHFPHIYVATSCLTNRFDDDSLTEHLIRNPNGGAVACWACSRYGWYTPESAGYGASDLMLKDFFNLLHRGYLEEPPSMGEIIHRARRKFMDRARGDGTFRWLTYGMNLLGCPEMPLWTNSPQSVEVDTQVGEVIETDGVQVTVTAGGNPVANAHVTILRQDTDSPAKVTIWGKDIIPSSTEVTSPVDLEGELFVTGKTDETGSVHLVPVAATGSAGIQVDDLLVLTESLAQLKEHLQLVKNDRKRLERLMRDYHYIEHRIEQCRRNLGVFFKETARANRWDVAEEALDTVTTRLQGPNGDPEALSFVLKSLGDATRFGWEAIKDAQSPQGRVFRKLLELKKQVGDLTEEPVNQQETASITVTSEPSGAEILIDGIPSGVTPTTVRGLAIGSHTVKVIAAGETIGTSTVEIKRKQKYVRHFKLESMRSFTGKITLFGNETNEGAVVQLLWKQVVDGKSKWVVYEEQTTGPDGKFSFKRLPATSLYASISYDSFNSESTWLRFNDSENKLHVNEEYEIFRLASISGTVSIPNEETAKLRLFQKKRKQFVVIKEEDIKDGASFSFDELPVGKYIVTLAAPGLTVARRRVELKDGSSVSDRELSIDEIETVHLGVYIGGDDPWEFHEMGKGKDGMYRITFPKEPSEKGYYFYFRLNKDLDTSCAVYDPNNLPAQETAQVSFIKFAEEGVEIVFDPTLMPLYHRTQKTSDGSVDILEVADGVPSPE